ncbi:CII family transcriptional regulator [Erwinia rhapontici]|uniref:CII family transcriptional regulator n=1 Tax=Erwinia rhapontici TaxID=55212 RepID=UPI003D35CDF3
MNSIATARNVKAREIQSEILSRIAVQGVTAVAKQIGVDKSQVSRWQSKGGLVEKASQLLAVIDFQKPQGLVLFQGEDTADLARGLVAMLDHLRSHAGGTGG